MVSKRQKEARKRFKQTNPPSEDASASASSKGEAGRMLLAEEKEKKKKKLQKKKVDGGLRKKSGGSALRKHPLRIPGMRPGESCFICKSTEHIAKLCPEKASWEKNKICLLCRQRGHSLKNCPEKSDTSKKKLCYNCGERGHSLSKCPLPLEDGGTKFASCFVCKEQGHLSKDCPKNTHGVYPKGGSCKICGEITHLAKFCPSKGKKTLYTSSSQQRSADRLEGLQQGSQKIRFSGDDLEDDFMEESVLGSKKDGISSTNSASDDVVKNIREKPKKQGPKIVNFLG